MDISRKILSGLRFVRAACAFSNPVQLIVSRVVNRQGVIVYRYKQYRLSSLESCADGVSIRECLAEKVYHEAIARSRPVNRPGSYINLGANIGAFDVALHEGWKGDIRGVAVEMNPWTCERLARNIAANRFETRVINAALLGRQGQVRVNVRRSGPGQSLAESADPDAAEVRALTLSGVPDPIAGMPVDLLKVDCEGSEYPVFAAARREDLERFRNMVIEIHPAPSGFSQERLAAEIAEKGRYHAHRLSRKDGADLMYFSRS